MKLKCFTYFLYLKEYIPNLFSHNTHFFPNKFIMDTFREMPFWP